MSGKTEKKEEKMIEADIVVDKKGKKYLLVKSCFLLMEEKKKSYSFRFIKSDQLENYKKIGTKNIPERYVAAAMFSC